MRQYYFQVNIKVKWQIQSALHVTGEFSEASNIKLLFLFETEEKLMFNIPVKRCVKYLGIHISKDMALRQQLNFLPKIKSILNMWLQRDLSIFRGVLLTKAEGMSTFVYPALSLFVNDVLCKDINNLFIKFV